MGRKAAKAAASATAAVAPSAVTEAVTEAVKQVPKGKLGALLARAGSLGKLGARSIPWLAAALSAYELGSLGYDYFVGGPKRKRANAAMEGLSLIDSLGAETDSLNAADDAEYAMALARGAEAGQRGGEIGDLVRQNELAQILAGHEETVRAAQPVNVPSMAEIMASLEGL